MPADTMTDDVPAQETRVVPIRRLPPSPLGPVTRVLLVLEVLAAYAQASRRLRRAPIEPVVAALRSDASLPAAIQGPEAFADARRLGWIVGRTLKLVPGDTRCLARSLVLTRLLARRGISAKLVIGARADPEFLAHAWVECEGKPVLSPGDGSFARLVEL
jgi:hypothetical protein